MRSCCIGEDVQCIPRTYVTAISCITCRRRGIRRGIMPLGVEWTELANGHLRIHRIRNVRDAVAPHAWLLQTLERLTS